MDIRRVGFSFSSPAHHLVPSAGDGAGCTDQTFAEVLHTPSPDAAALVSLKLFAKRLMDDPRRLLPEDVALVLYYASIVAALIRCRKRITELSDAELREGIGWALQRRWLDERTRGLFEQGLGQLEQPSADARRGWRQS